MASIAMPQPPQQSQQQQQHTIYLKNLCTRTKKNELRRSLYTLFSTFGKIIDVYSAKTTKMRGQAFVTFVDPACTQAALRAGNGLVFYGKPMIAQLARGKAKVISMLDGSWMLEHDGDKDILESRKRKRDDNYTSNIEDQDDDTSDDDDDDENDDDASHQENNLHAKQYLMESKKEKEDHGKFSDSSPAPDTKNSKPVAEDKSSSTFSPPAKKSARR